MSKNLEAKSFNVIKGALFSLFLAFIGILLLAFLDKIFKFNSASIKVINQFIKTISIFIGATLCIRNQKGLLKGLALGLIFSVVLHLIFYLMGTDVKFSKIIIDCLFSGILGMISGIISVNFISKSDI